VKVYFKGISSSVDVNLGVASVGTSKTFLRKYHQNSYNFLNKKILEEREEELE